jgi:hypothetical protein
MGVLDMKHDPAEPFAAYSKAPIDIPKDTGDHGFWLESAGILLASTARYIGWSTVFFIFILFPFLSLSVGGIFTASFLGRLFSDAHPSSFAEAVSLGIGPYLLLLVFATGISYFFFVAYKNQRVRGSENHRMWVQR